ncbi:MAG: hypothetical protein ABIS29_10015 [Vicinamibacterales bacterium]
MLRLKSRIASPHLDVATTPLRELRHTDFIRCMKAGMSSGDTLALVRASGLAVFCAGLESGRLFAQGED